MNLNSIITGHVTLEPSNLASAVCCNLETFFPIPMTAVVAFIAKPG